MENGRRLLAAAAKLAVFLMLSAAACLWLAAKAERAYRPKDPGQTKQALYFIPENAEVDLLFLGSSRGRAFSHYGNHGRVEKILGRRIVNLSAEGGGILPAKILLSYFHSRGNRAKHVVFFIDHADILADKANEDSPFLALEPLRADLLPHILAGGLSPARILQYFYMKLQKPYKTRAILTGADLRRLGGFSRAQAARQLDERQFDGRGWSFARRVARLEDIVRSAKGRGAALTFVLLPGAFYDKKEKDFYRSNLWIRFMEKFGRENGAAVLDLRMAVPETGHYADPLHLNSDGVNFFTTNFLKPALEKDAL